MDAPSPPLSKNAVAFGLSLALCSLLNAALVIAKEKSAAVNSWMQHATGHHWITHVVLVLGVFLLAGFALGQANGGAGPKVSGRHLTTLILGAVIGGVAIILGFYLAAG